MSETTQIVADAARSRNMQLRGNFRRSAQGREIVVVLGMHRSGTSLLANILHLLGVDMLDQPTHASTKNETGFWERQDILALQDEILVTLGVPVGSPAHAVPFASGWWRSVEIRPLKERLRDLVGEHLKTVRRPWGFKDPRTCRLLPLWGEILEELDVSPRFVWAVRHPAESSRSMTEKNPLRRPIPVAQSEVMWLAYNYDILRYAGRHWPLVVPYEAWFGDALSLTKDLAQELDLVWQGSDHELETALSELINPDQRHHWAAGGGGKLRCALALSEEVYRSILSLRNVSEANVSETLAMSLQSLLGAVQPFALEARESRTLKEDAQHLAAEMKVVQAHLDEATAQIASHVERAERQRENEAILAARVDTLTRKMNDARAERDAIQAEAIAARADLEQQIAGTKADAARLAGERDALQAELAKAGRLADEHTRRLADAEVRHGEIAARLAQVQEERDRLEERLAQSGEERNALRKDIQTAIAGREMATKDFGEVSGKLEGFRKQLAAALSGREALEQKLAAALSGREALEQKLAAALSDREALEQKLATALSDRESLEQKLAAALSERDTFGKELASLNTKLDGFRSKMAHAIETRDEMQRELATLRAERDGLAAELAEATEARSSLRDEVSALSSSQAASERDLAAANQKLDGFRKQIASGSEAREKLQESLGAAVAERDMLNQTLADLRDELQRARDGAALETQQLSSQLAEARSGITLLEDRYSVLSAAHEALAAELAEARQTAQQSLDTAAREQERLAQALDAVSKDREGLASQAAEADADVRSQRMLISRLQADADRLKSEFLTTKNALRSERERIAELTASLPKD